MSRYERGVYEPSDDVRVFDGAEEEEDEEGSRLPLLIMGALLVLAMFAGLVWMAYSEGVARGRSETPILAAAPGPARVAPASPGGADVQYQGFKIYEQPAPPDDEADATPPGAPPPPAGTPAPAEAAKPDTPPPAAVTPPPAQAAAPAKPMEKAEVPPPPAKPVPPAPKPAPAKVEPAATPAPAKPAATVATGAPRALPGVSAAPKPVAAAPVPATGGYVLQIGAYKSQADADAAWKAYKTRHAALLAGYGPDVQRADLGDKGVWYRLRVAGFSDRAVAGALCDRLKADGGGCFLGK